MTLTPEYFEHDMDALRERAEAAEVAVGTLQTALRQLAEEWRGAAGTDYGTNYSEYRRGESNAYTECAEELLALLPALEPTP